MKTYYKVFLILFVLTIIGCIIASIESEISITRAYIITIAVPLAGTFLFWVLSFKDEGPVI